MKDKKNTSIIWFVASSISYLTAIIWCFALDNRSIAIMFGCIASAMLCLGAVQLNKEKVEKTDEDKTQ